MHRSATRRILVALTILAGMTPITATPSGAYEGAPYFEPGETYDENFPDPSIIVVDGTYYAYATTTGGQSMPVMSSTDLVAWTARGDALGTGPSWTPAIEVGWNIWAPTVVELPNGGFLAAFAASIGTSERRCIATARSDSPLGPFTTIGTAPFVCEPDPNGALDPFLIVDDQNVPWLVWKNEGVPVGHPTLASRRTGFWSRQLTDDGGAWRSGSSVHFLMETTELVRPWQGTVVENPAMTAWDGGYFLSYSANRYDSASYATGWARCATPGGPCVEPSTQPLLVSDAGRLGPGGPTPFVDLDGILRIGYHGWIPPFTSYPSFPTCDRDGDGLCPEAQRPLFIDAICMAGDRAFVYTPHREPFCDVGPGRYYTDAVAWLATNDITTGISPSAYGAHQPVNRGQMATFLWRLMGEPSPESSASFADVDPGRFYAEAVAWLAQEGITTGLTRSSFGPDGTVTRAQMATFLWRLVGEPAASSSTGFTDVPDAQWFTGAVAWLADSGVTTGVAPGRFDPFGIVTRDQMAAFLCRLSVTDSYAAVGAPTDPCREAGAAAALP